MVRVQTQPSAGIPASVSSSTGGVPDDGLQREHLVESAREPGARGEGDVSEVPALRDRDGGPVVDEGLGAGSVGVAGDQPRQALGEHEALQGSRFVFMRPAFTTRPAAIRSRASSALPAASSSSGTVMSSACQPPSARSCSPSEADRRVAIKPGTRAAAVRA